MGNFKVSATGGTILTRTGRAVSAGGELTSEDIGSAENELIRDRKIYRIGASQIAEKAPASTGPTSEALVLDTDGKLKPKAQIDSRLTSTAPAPTPPQRLTGIWTCPVDTLVNKSLEELNAMVMERDNTISPFDDKNEAIAQLSMDVIPAK